jgi:hypothetical protein
MMTTKPSSPPTEPTKRTTVDIPQSVWRAGKIRALDENVSFETLIARALALYCQTPLAAPAKKAGPR